MTCVSMYRVSGQDSPGEQTTAPNFCKPQLILIKNIAPFGYFLMKENFKKNLFKVFFVLFFLRF